MAAPLGLTGMDGASPKERFAMFVGGLGPNVKVIDRPERDEMLIRVGNPRSPMTTYELAVTYAALTSDESRTMKYIAGWFTSLSKGTPSEEEKMFDLTAYIEEQPVVVPKKKLGTWALHDDDK